MCVGASLSLSRAGMFHSLKAAVDVSSREMGALADVWDHVW